jgi:hypothetical protein
MATILNAGTTTATALNITTDTTGAMKIQTSGVDAISISSSQAVTIPSTLTLGSWTITPSGTKLYFSYNGTNVASMDSSGNFKSLLTVAAGTTP